MKRVLLTDSAADHVLRIQGNNLNAFSDEKGVIAYCFGVLSTLLCLGRDCEEIQNNADGILNVMEALNRYNDLLTSLSETNERNVGGYEYVEPEQDYDEYRDAAVCHADGGGETRNE